MNEQIELTEEEQVKEDLNRLKEAEQNWKNNNKNIPRTKGGHNADRFLKNKKSESVHSELDFRGGFID